MGALLIRSLAAGFLLAIPVGPLGAMALRRMLTKGVLHGIFFGIGFAFVDFIYALLIGFGMQVVTEIVIRYQKPLFLAGGFFFLAAGIKIFFTEADVEAMEGTERIAYVRSSVLAFVLALTSPATFFAFAAVFAGFKLGFRHGRMLDGIISVGGVVLGGMLWWSLFSILVGWVKKRIPQRFFKHVNRFFGGLLIVLVLFLVLFQRRLMH